ncbi:MAG: winged helix DNA-binding domain-containing protein [Solirubrobacterales bacterium]
MAPRTLTNLQLNRALLARQQLLKRKRVAIPRLLDQIGPLQTQEPKDAFVALWSRIEGFDSAKLKRAAEQCEIVRGSNLRCTIHTVSAADFLDYRLLLSSVIERDTANWRDRYIGLDIAKVSKAVRALLADGQPRSAREIREVLAPKFPKVHPEGISHCARIHVPVVMTPTEDRWGYSRPPKLMTAEQWFEEPLRKRALGDLLLRGIAAVGPASTADLRTWSGMPGVREALEPHLPELMVFRDEVGRELYDLPDAPRPRADTPAPVRFLGEYDNFALSHADRSRIGDSADAKLLNWSKNGRRAFTLLIDGHVRATWQINVTKSEARLTIMPFRKEPKAALDELAAEGQRFIEYMEPDAASHVVEFAKTDLRK